MHRRSFIGLLTGLLAVKTAAPQVNKTWYITGGHSSDGSGGDCTIPPIVVHAPTRIDALLSVPFTVWSEEEYANFQRRSGQDFKEGCAKIYGDRAIK